MRSLLSGLTPADIRREPFPHIVARAPMAPETYAALSESFPPLSLIAWSGAQDRLRSNRRYELSAQAILDTPDLPDCWKEFVATHSAPALVDQVAELFQGFWPEPLLQQVGGDLRGHVTSRLVRWSDRQRPIRQDARIEVNTPVLGSASSSRGAHLDTPNRLFSGLFYMRHPDDDSIGGDLQLFRWTADTPIPTDRYELPADSVEVAATIPYAANQLVLFPQNIRAIHGVSPRHPTPHVRRYVFITAELAQDWLVPARLHD